MPLDNTYAWTIIHLKIDTRLIEIIPAPEKNKTVKQKQTLSLDVNFETLLFL